MNQFITSPFGHRHSNNEFILSPVRRSNDWTLENITIEIKSAGWINVYATSVYYIEFYRIRSMYTRLDDISLDDYDLEGRTLDEITEYIYGNFFNWVFRIKKRRILRDGVWLRQKQTKQFQLKTSNWTIKQIK